MKQIESQSLSSLDFLHVCRRLNLSRCYGLFFSGIQLAPAAQKQPPCCSPVLLPSSTALAFIVVCALLHLSLSVCPLPTSSTHHVNLPRPPYPTPPRPLLPTAVRPFPHFARRLPHECQAGIQGVCRRASLAGGAGAPAGRTRRLDRVRLTTTTACCDDWLLSPWPFHTGACRAMSGAGLVACCDVWNALIFFFFSRT